MSACFDEIFSKYQYGFRKGYSTQQCLLVVQEPATEVLTPFLTKVLSAGSLCGPLVPSTQSKCPKRTIMLPQKYHVLISNMLSKPLKCFMEYES